ncbi:TIGR01244 family sulfur transferase [Qipengyuania marisflavi]|uniref:TIGR01244 family phosphatase n=1 Tax=Qipengyuania marisflavi TaxID=2486356 RepID=A0A5S3P4V7_9SPHN|nr:TIGR01244 family sulfur transferase [Qipengyuania marisflavi]TMM48072.1 TIGR01244 family phosphatase [Qipengyuania marisflavi]
MTGFKILSETMMVSPQITAQDVATAQQQGVTLVINNRPDGEAPDQPAGEGIAQAARDLGMDYCAIPVTQAGFSVPQVEQMAQAMAETAGKTLAFCRSGTRSTFLWALAEAKAGRSPQEITAAAQQAGYDVGSVRATMDMLASQTGS